MPIPRQKEHRQIPKNFRPSPAPPIAPPKPVPKPIKQPPQDLIQLMRELEEIARQEGWL